MEDLGTINELTSSRWTGTLVDESGLPIDGTTLTSLTLTAYDVSTGEIVNGRDAQDVLNKNGVTVSAGGIVVWTMEPEDNTILGMGSTERKAAQWVATWASGTKQCVHERTWVVQNLDKLTG